MKKVKMSDKFETITLSLLLEIALKEYRKNNSIFGIPKELFYYPSDNFHLKTSVFNQIIDNPVGVAAGPHTQMAQNIVAAWLMGARYIELKTIQTLDELEIAKPCIDMQDEGYNCEWSQELKISASFNEYLNAWIIIHIFNDLFGFKQDIHTVFNMSVGYNMEGILKPNVQWFFEKMNDCSAELDQKIKEIKNIYPDVEKIIIPSKISDNITLSTMHGCPANEIEEIAGYLLKAKKLHTFVKLNPTLIGKEKLREIINGNLKFKTQIPDIAFEHDLKYDDALLIIRSLQRIAGESGLQFGLKLTNTLESVNNKSVFDSEVEMMYMSGRALHPVSINLADKLQNDLKGEILFSFSAGVDAFNVSETLACGFKPITVCSDLLKPGGYMRLHQYFEELGKSFKNFNAQSVDEFICLKSDSNDTAAGEYKNLSEYALKVLDSDPYKREYLIPPNIKTKRSLSYFDCISAPCTDTCSTHQDIPEYLYYASTGNYNKAFEIILKTNPFPSITGMVCDHLCQNKCTRINYDDPVLIREVKRFISEKNAPEFISPVKNGIKAAVIGAGPSGLSCAYYLSLAGFDVDVFEEHSKAGGMVQYAIPGFRLSDEAIEKDFKRVTDIGVKIFYDHKIDKTGFDQTRENYDFIYISIGAKNSLKLEIEGNESEGVMEPLDFLFRAKKGEINNIGNNIVIIGGGNTAMDAARTAFRLSGENAKVSIVYRRTVTEMPADQGEIRAVMEEGVEIIELAAPIKIVSENGKVKSLICVKMKLGEKDSSGRPKPEIIPGSEFKITCDVIIPAIGQKVDMDFLAFDNKKNGGLNYKTGVDNIYIGGDSLRGASTAINAIGDGRKVAEKIIMRSGQTEHPDFQKNIKRHELKDLIIKRAERVYGAKVLESPLKNRKSFDPVSFTLDEETIKYEADRCLYCDEICNICTTVCPNFANYSYDIEPIKLQLQKITKNESGQYDVRADQHFIIKQTHQILNIANFCNECGNCTTFCPTNSAPYKEKPKVHLTKESFDKNNEGYYFDRNDNKNTLYYKNINNFHKLLVIDNKYIYESNDCYCEFETVDFSISNFKVKNKKNTELNFQKAAEMYVILKGLEQLV